MNNIRKEQENHLQHLAIKSLPATLRWTGDIDGHLELIDQRLLPNELIYIKCATTEEVYDAIKNLAVRGAPAIGVTASYGAFISARNSENPLNGIEKGCDILKTSRPTAVNLFWALDRMQNFAHRLIKQTPNIDRDTFLIKLLDEARAIHREDIQMCYAIGKNGSHLIQNDYGVLTHCNAGSLATSYFGTALAVIYQAHLEGKHFSVFADETRPVLQGARLTQWELSQAGVNAILICDDMAGYAMRCGKINLVITGADRIAANGDTANKIGTYSIAVLAKEHNIPFYIAAPASTFDLNIADGSKIPIEQRNGDEIRRIGTTLIAKSDAQVWNPAFDVTPADLITGIITDKGIIESPNKIKIAEHLEKS